MTFGRSGTGSGDTVDLDKWQIADCAPGEGHAAAMSVRADGWIDAEAPGDTYLALFAAGRVPHPFSDENEAACAWVKDREWWWRCTFPAEPLAADERLELQFDGLDTFATIWLNGVMVGETSNMFLGCRFDIGAILKDDGDNTLLIRFTPPALMVADKHMATWPIIADPIQESKRNFIRKAQFGWGWDWGPRLPTVGIWRAVRVERHRLAAIRDVRFETLSIGAGTEPATVRVSVDIENFTEAAVSAAITLIAPDGSVAAETSFDPVSVTSVGLSIADPRLWWTPELGMADLYTLHVRLSADGTKVAHDERRVGIRTVTLDTSPDPDEPGCDFFRFVLNNVPIFARGANWVPASSFVGAVTAADYGDLLGRAAAANMNMMRVWGGGIYEHDAFYEECDRLGLLVWQDFMFACAPYPEHDIGFVESVRQEVAFQVKRLRSHACLALWCGNNEGDAVQAFMNRLTGTTTKFLGDLYIHDIMPETLARLDPATPYWPGSPSGGPSHNSMRAGDVHNWTVWHGLPPTPDAVSVGSFDRSPAGVAYTRYAEDMSRFVSEFGIQAAPALATLERWIANDELGLRDEAFLNRIKDHPQDKVDAMLLPVTGLPATVAQYVDYTQLMQAEGLKYGIEHYRRRKPHNSGTLIWQYNDCWPGITWSLIDGDGVAKPSWYAVRRAYAPVAASLKDLGDGMIELWIVNDALSEVEVAARIALVTTAGDTLFEEVLEFRVPANCAAPFWRGSPEGAPDRVLTVRSKQFPDNRHLFAPPMHLSGIGEPIVVGWETTTGGVILTINAPRYAYGVHLTADDPAARFSDNWFDLAAGESRTVVVSGGPGELAAGNVTVRSILQR